jgi:hypothetical protein
MKKSIYVYSLLAASLLAMLVSCGGGGGGTPATTSAADTTLSFTGVAAVGAPMANATITVRDAAGATFTTTADALGAYSFTNIAAKAPLQLQASATMGTTDVTHFALVPALDANKRANISPLTTAVAALVSSTDTPAAMTASAIAAMSASDISKATTNVNTVIAPMLAALNLPSSYNPVTSALTANGQGADLMLDHLSVKVRSSGVTIANKMAVTAATEDSTAANGSSLSKTLSTVPAALPSATITTTDGFDALAAKFQACFAVSETLRLTSKTTSSATLHTACQGIASSSYLHNGYPFINRWASALNSSTMTGATFARPVVRLRVQAAPEQIAVNFNFIDNAGVGYTKPELIEKQTDNTWLLVGNQRNFNFFPEASLTYLDDVSSLSYNNTNFSRLESAIRLSLDQRFAFSSTGEVSNTAANMTSSSGSSSSSFKTLAATIPGTSRMVGCVVVKGPGAWNTARTKWSGFHPNGILMKRPDASTRQDYMGIDSTVRDEARTAINAITVPASGNLGAGQAVSFTIGSSTYPNICTNNLGSNRAGSSTTLTDTTNVTQWETLQSNNNYAVEVTALGARTNVLTGIANDSTIVGRNVAWNTGARYAREAPSAGLATVFDNNPKISYEVFDTDGKLRAVFSSRYIGELPPAQMAKTYIDNKMVSTIDRATLSSYLDFAANTATSKSTATTFTGTWTTPSGAFGADRISLYSEVIRSETGTGLANITGSKVNSLWASDPELATELNAVTGTNFYWWNSGNAKPTGTTTCSGSALISTTGFEVSRQTLALTASLLDADYYGSDQLASACIAASGSTTTQAHLYREIGTRTYTDTNVRLYYVVGNKALR